MHVFTKLCEEDFVWLQTPRRTKTEAVIRHWLREKRAQRPDHRRDDDEANEGDGVGCLLDGCCLAGCLLDVFVLTMVLGGLSAMSVTSVRSIAS